MRVRAKLGFVALISRSKVSRITRDEVFPLYRLVGM